MSIIPLFPDSAELSYDHIPRIQSFLMDNRYAISEYSVASLIPFTHKRGYTVSSYVQEHGEEAFLFIGNEKDHRFAMIPAGYPGQTIMNELKTMVYEREHNSSGTHRSVDGGHEERWLSLYNRRG